ncbi:hypothetical protein SEA_BRUTONGASTER_1 [Gordonia phage BrutonGaster]|uniref:Uncharacterized protein n=1 Tax=Gordonia phage BrutonGaster TaxID=2530116 RepID=A0A482JKD9_9CAUD|nr:hypothetical protein HOV26_gp001 [Gordonia phage BrutonGaster]QBP33223.1 hypothetical protein SEA_BRUTONGASTER_1 [Gordonia phage BrutonGaster]
MGLAVRIDEVRVAAVIDHYTIAINRGELHGINAGMIYGTSPRQPEPVYDPEDGELIGYVRMSDEYKVEVTRVHNRWAECVLSPSCASLPDLTRVKFGDYLYLLPVA